MKRALGRPDGCRPVHDTRRFGRSARPCVRRLRAQIAACGSPTGCAGLRSWFRYYHGLIYRYRRTRFVALYPVYPLASTFSSIRWIWADSLTHRGIGAKLVGSLETLASSPYWYAQELVRWLRGEPQH